MLKLFYKILVGCFTLVWLTTGCMQKPTAPSGQVWIDLKLNYQYDADAGLHKSNRLIESQVLMLTFDEGSGDSIYDHSPYKNHAVLHDNTIWGTLDSRRSISIESQDSYATVNYHPTLDGTHSLALTATIYLYYESVTRERVILDKHDYFGGYTLGINHNNRVFFRVRNNLREKEIISDSVLTAGQWQTITAKYSTRPLSISIFQQTDTDTTNMPLTLPHTWSPLVIGVANDLAGAFTDPLTGLIDQLSISTTSNFEDFDFVRVAVMDLNKFIHSDSLRNLTTESLYHYFMWHDSSAARYIREQNNIFYPDSAHATLPDWATLRRLWDSYFTVISEQNLHIKDSFAEGSIAGIPGLNLVSVGALRNNVLVYYGEALVWGRKDQVTTVAIDLSLLGHER